jgi:hypothetical protein
MSTNLEIPAEVIGDVRMSVLCLLGDAAEEISQALTRPQVEFHPEWFVDGRDELERACALLDLIGWDGTLRPQSTEAHLDEHGRTLRDALRRFLPLVETELEEVGLNDERRAQLGEPPRREQVTGRLLALRAFMSLVEQRTQG